jgi:SpoIID/LytB domain protein
MCQWGAYGQAKQGKKADEILKYYYPGADVVSIDTIRLKL